MPLFLRYLFLNRRFSYQVNGYRFIQQELNVPASLNMSTFWIPAPSSGRIHTYMIGEACKINKHSKIFITGNAIADALLLLERLRFIFFLSCRSFDCVAVELLYIFINSCCGFHPGLHICRVLVWNNGCPMYCFPFFCNRLSNEAAIGCYIYRSDHQTGRPRKIWCSGCVVSPPAASFM